MEPVESLVRNNAAFIAERQFETDEADPCWHAFLMWDMATRRRVNVSHNPWGSDWFRGGSDEIGLASGLFLSGKNLYRPVAEQIRKPDAYAADFLEGQLIEQPGWRVHRMVPRFVIFEPWKGRGADDVWRAFNYVHVANRGRQPTWYLYNMDLRQNGDLSWSDSYILKSREIITRIAEAAVFQAP